MGSFPRFRRHKKTAAAAAAAAATAASGGDATPTDTAAAAAAATAQTSAKQSRPKTSAGLPTATIDSPPVPDPAEETRPMTSSSHALSTSSSFLSVNGAPSTVSSLDPKVQQQQQQAMRGPLRSSRSPFRDRLRSSAKRSRGSPSPATTPPALPRSPTNGLSHQMQSISLPSNGGAVSPPKSAVAKAGGQGEKRLSTQSRSSSNKPAMPSFLTISPLEIKHKFHDITWLERNRVQNSFVAPNGRWTRVSGPHLRILDRYVNIQPWEKNRVRLKVPAGEVDYINASPIVLTTTAPAHTARPPDRYIAMQGPKQNSVDHVWRMVYEQTRSPAVIVMLTETHAANQEKCFQYFPRSPEDPPMMLNEHDEFSDGFHASVHCEAIEETPYGDAIELRRIALRVHKKASPVQHAKSVSIASSTDASTKSKDLANDANGNAKKTRGPSPIGKLNGRRKAGKDDDNDSVMSEASAGSASSPATAAPSASVPSLTEINVAAAIKAIDINEFEDERIVYHFLYKRWPDFGVPALEDVDSFLGLMHLSAEKNADAENPRIVHCSAGVGRSGTFIALEHLLRELDAGVLEDYDGSNVGGDAKDEVMEGSDDHGSRVRGHMPPLQQHDSESSASGGAGTVDRSSVGSGVLGSESDDLIYTTVNQLREQRCTMVQAETQYHFIYQVLRKMWQEKYGVANSDGSRVQRQSHDSTGVYDEEGSEGSDGSEPAAKRLEVDLATTRK